MAALKVGLMGLGRGGMRVARTLIDSPWCELAAVASLQSKRTEEFRNDHPGIATYDDFRSLIISAPLDALFVAVPPYLRPKYLPLAAERQIPVWMLTPAARRFDEALEVLSVFEKAGCPIVVARQWNIEPSLQPDALGLGEVGRFFFARGNVTLCLTEDLDWRGDSQRAGGGVLLCHAYGMIDTLIQLMGLPSTVYARIAGVSRPGTRFPYDTEDTAGLVCNFAGGGLAVLGACWTAGPTHKSLDLHGLNGYIRIDDTRVEVRDRTGEIGIHNLPRSANELDPQIDAFLSELASASGRYRGTLRQHLPTLALIEAAYLSAQTGQPESPAAILRMHDVHQ
ncbi:MAG TPA: Gfo/Idh/MocA family oxidoreductase [Phycisphaerae bacterium]|nr:Gfo/Idh/MocA family oxidoreductase [Phycisphaerae bacterium]